MAGIKTPILDLVTKLKTLSLPNNAGNTQAVHADIWNEQLDRLEDGESYPFNLPACFVELLMANNYQQLGAGITSSDLTFRIHLAMEQIDSLNGDMDQNTTVFDYRDAIIALLTHYEPTACSMLMHVNDEQDFGHNNLYIYLIDFACHFIDDKGSKYPTNESVPVTGLTINDGFNKLEILGVTYSGTTLTVQYKLIADSQEVKFNLPVAGLVSDGTKAAGEHTFTKTALSLTSGDYTLTGKAMTDNYTTQPYKFIV